MKRMNGASEAVSVAGILGRLESELTNLARLADQLQEAIGELIAQAPPAPRHSFLSKVQNLDLLVQSLHGIATYLSILSRAVPAGWTLDPGAAASAVKLSNLAQRLLDDAARGADDGQGDCVLF
ncbi:MAG: hypothetical protein HY659_13905 [Rhizobiales bacterium]|nr:hypothetical protein [Hyphomicrobiales bacterium]